MRAARRTPRAPAAVRAGRGPGAGFGIAGGYIVHRRPDGTERAAAAAVVDSPDRPAPGRRRRGRGGGRRGSPGVPPEAMQRGRRDVPRASSTRSSRWPMVGGVRFVNDSKATNIEAARRALESFAAGRGARSSADGSRAATGACCDRRCQARAHGRRRHRRVGAAGARGVRGPGARARGGVDGRGGGARVRSWRRAEGVVLLAPACASFDMFRDYAERGRVFKAAVAAPGGHARERVSGEQSSVRESRWRAGRWERRLPRSARLVSSPTCRLMTADRSRRSGGWISGANRLGPLGSGSHERWQESSATTGCCSSPRSR